jgi:hypothetical protein
MALFPSCPLLLCSLASLNNTRSPSSMWPHIQQRLMCRRLNTRGIPTQPCICLYMAPSSAICTLYVPSAELHVLFDCSDAAAQLQRFISPAHRLFRPAAPTNSCLPISQMDLCFTGSPRFAQTGPQQQPYKCGDTHARAHACKRTPDCSLSALPYALEPRSMQGKKDAGLLAPSAATCRP